MTQPASHAAAQPRTRPSTPASAAPKKSALRERTLRFTGDAVLVVGGLNVLLLAAMFWVGYVNGKKAARAELKLASVGAAEDPRLRSDAEAKQEWEPPASIGESPGEPKGDPGANDKAAPTAPSTPNNSGSAAAAGDKASSGATTPGATTEEKPQAAPQRIWVVQAASYDMSKKDLAEFWKQTLVGQNFEKVELYKLGKERPMIGLCVGEAGANQDLQDVLKRVQEFTSRNDRPFASASITQLDVKR